jgi:hypothetical protein
MRMHRLLAVALCFALAACQGGGDEEGGAELSAEDAAKADALLHDYESARTAGNPEAAESAADKLRDKYGDSEQALKLDATLSEVRAGAEAMRDKRRLEKLWDYQDNAAGKGVQHTAGIYSKVPDMGEEAPAAVPDAQLILRDHPEWGRSVYLLLQQKNFNCGSPCKLQLSFNDGPLETWPGKQADSGKGPALFIEDEPRFMKALPTARTVRIVLPKGSGNITSLTFELAGFDPTHYK